MSVIHNDLLLATDEATGYNLTKSVRLRASASAYLSRTLSTPTNSYKWTWSGWVKKANIGSNTNLFNAYTGANNRSFLTIYSGSEFAFYSYASGSYPVLLTASQVLRDPAGWYHIVLSYDSTQATSTNRVKGWINGQQVTFNTDTTYPTQNTATDFNTATVHNIGRDGYNTNSYLDGYLTEVNFVDGQGLAATDFGETDSITGVWKPKRYTDTYGTNGFYLPFTDVATTSGSNAGLGKDFSGNGNYWTTNNISVTSGATYDSMTDVPTLTSATAANYCVVNPITPSSSAITNGNLTMGYNSNSASQVGTVAVSSAKWYFETTITSQNTSQLIVGVANSSFIPSTSTVGANANGWGLIVQNNANNGQAYHNGSVTSSYATFTAGDVVMVAYDVTNGYLWFGRNGTWFNSGVPASGTGYIYSGVTGTIFPAFTNNDTSGGVLNINFGQRPFAYTPPSGYVALNTYNLPDSTIVAGNTVMDVSLWTGTGSSQTITNSGGMKPDLVWSKIRSGADGHFPIDTVRGIDKYLITNSTAAEATDAQEVTSVNSNGFTVGTSTNANRSGYTFVAWQWQAGQGTTSSNTDGSITSTVSVNASAGFSIITATAPSSGNFTFGHGLGVKPAFFITKIRSPSGYNWHCWHQSLSSNTNSVIVLNSTAAENTTYNMWGASGANSTTIGATVGTSFDVSSPFVCYAWSEIAGFSKFGSYTGNGSTDGPFVYTGFRPKFVMYKNSSAGSTNWTIIDSSRSPHNGAYLWLYPNVSDAEANPNAPEDLLSNGFKIRTDGSYVNGSGNTIIYAAFAENPFKNSLAR